MPNFKTLILVFYFACMNVYIYMYLCEMVFAIFCLYFIHTNISECMFFNCIVETN